MREKSECECQRYSKNLDGEGTDEGGITVGERSRVIADGRSSVEGKRSSRVSKGKNRCCCVVE